MRTRFASAAPPDGPSSTHPAAWAGRDGPSGVHPAILAGRDRQSSILRPFLAGRDDESSILLANFGRKRRKVPKGSPSVAGPRGKERRRTRPGKELGLVYHFSVVAL